MKNKTLAMIFAGVAVLGAVGAKLIGRVNNERPIAYVYENGKLVEEIDLSKIDKEYTIELGGNTILVEPNQISVIKADCPDKLCIGQGVISNGAKSIICLPNQVEIKIRDGKDTKDVDAVTG